MIKKILILAGEASGDLLGADLARELQRLQPSVALSALGGECLRAAGVEIIFDNRAMGVVGWWEVLKNLSVIRRAMRTIKNRLRNDPPDLLILIDYPGFNLRMAALAKRYGIKVLYYVSPQIWAWKYGRIKTIRRCVDHMAVLFPFEEEIYRREHVPVTYVGHPLVNRIRADRVNHPAQPVVALFPGSRRQEVERLMPEIMGALPLIRAAVPDVQFLMPLASTLCISDLQPYLTPDVRVVTNDIDALLSTCSAAVVKSGTATLEVALSQVPLLIIYKGNWLNYWIARMVVCIRQIGLCNIVAEKPIAREFIQQAVTPENIATETIRLLTDFVYRRRILQDLADLRIKMGQPKNSQQVAQIAFKMLEK
jgi:lipid-A-disaccharide synthase